MVSLGVVHLLCSFVFYGLRYEESCIYSMHVSNPSVPIDGVRIPLSLSLNIDFDGVDSFGGDTFEE